MKNRYTLRNITHRLLSLALIIPFSLFFIVVLAFDLQAQNNTTDTKSISYPLKPNIQQHKAIQKQMIGIEPAKASTLVASKKIDPPLIPHTKSTNIVSIINIGTSANAYSYGYSGGQKSILWAVPELNMVTNFHRMGGGLDPGGYSGDLGYDVSFDGGLSWENMIEIYIAENNAGSYYTDAARYPQHGVWNPVDNTDPDNAWLSYFAPNLDGSNSSDSWGGYSYGTVNMGDPSIKTKNLQPSADPFYQYIPDGFDITKDGRVFVLDVNQNWSNGSADYQGSLILNKGVWNETEGEFIFEQELLDAPITEALTRPSNAQIAFAEDGQTGYISFLGDNGTTNVINAQPGYYPIIMKTTDGGNTWSEPQGIQLGGPNGLAGIVNDLLTDAQIAGLYEEPLPLRDQIPYTTAFDHNISVDAYGNLHIGIVIGVVGDVFYSIRSVSDLIAAYDIYTIDGGLSWQSVKLGHINQFRGTWPGDYTEDNRIQITTSPDRTVMFISWQDTDLEGMEDNTRPNIFSRGIAVQPDGNVILTCNEGNDEPANVTLFSQGMWTATFFVAAQKSFFDGNVYTIPMTYQPVAPDVDPGEPVQYKYISDFSFALEDFCEEITPLYGLTLNVAPYGAATVSGNGQYAEGTSVTVEISSINIGYQFVNWTDNEGNIVSEELSFTYIMPAENVTFQANFNYDANTEEELYFNDFDDYTVGDYIAVVDPDNWTTWFNNPGSAEDALIVDEQSASPEKAVKVDGFSDLVFKLGDKTSGKYKIKFNYYVPSGFGAYYNFQHYEAAGIEFAFEVYFAADGTGYMHAGGNNAATFTYNHDEWIEITNIIDLDEDWAQVYFDEELIYEWQFSLGYNGNVNLLQMGCINFYVGAPSGETSTYFIDDLAWVALAPPLENPTIDINSSQIIVDIPVNESTTLNRALSNTGESVLFYDIVTSFDESAQKAASPVVSTARIGRSNGVPVADPNYTPGPAAPANRDITLTYSGNNAVSIGMANASAWRVAARFPADMVNPYNGMYLTAVDVFIYNPADAHKIQIYDMGSINQPGPGVLIYEQDFSPNPYEWTTVDLTQPVYISGRDIWVGYWMDQPAGIYPAGIDAGSAHPDGDWLSSGPGWSHLSDNPDLDGNWNIRAQLAGEAGPVWLTVNPNNGSLNSGEFDDLNINFDASNLTSNAQYQAKMIIRSNDPEAEETVIDVILNTTAICNHDWVPNPNLQFNMQVIAQIMIDDAVSINPNDVLGAFVGDECRGIGSPIDGSGLVFLSVGSNEATGEEIELKIWNSSLCEFCEAGSGFTFENLGEVGTFENPLQASCITDVDLNLSFGQGYTWFSENLAPEDAHPNNMFDGLSACNNDRLIGQSNFSVYYNGSWNGTITAMNPFHSYRMKLCEAQEFTATAPPAEITPIPLNAGYTWLGYLPQGCLPSNEALANITPPPTANDRLIGQSSFALFTGTAWIGSLTTLCPGEGYVIKLANASALTYPEASANGAMNKRIDTEADSPIGVMPQRNLQYSMTVLGQIELPTGQYSSNTNDRIYAYINDHCVGMANPMETESGLIFLSVGENSDEAQEVSFKIWLDEQQQLYQANETMTFVPLKGEGVFNEPFKFTLGNPVVDQDDWFVGEPYPNPFTEETVVPMHLKEPAKVNLILYDVAGQVVLSTEKAFITAGKQELHLKKETLKTGVYTLNIQILNNELVLSKSHLLIIY
jgi:hypothetical protein